MTSEDTSENKFDGGLTAEDKELETQLIVEQFKKLKGVAEKTALKLIDAGYYSLEQIAIADPRDFVDRTGMSEKAVKQIIADAGSLMNLEEPKSIFEALEEKKKIGNLGYITTGSKEIDSMLGGGLHPGLITEIHGINKAGKTQFCETVGVWVVSHPDDYIIYVDAENTCNEERILQMCRALGFNQESLNRFIRIRANNSAQQIKVMDAVNRFAGTHNVKLLVIDSVISHFRNEYIGRGSLNERQQLLNRYLGVLHNFAIANNAVVLITNQIMDNPDGFMYGSHLPVGGNVLGHACPYRIMLRNGQAGKRVARLAKAYDRPDGIEVLFRLSDKGVTDIEDKSKKSDEE